MKFKRTDSANVKANLRFYYHQYCLSEHVDSNTVLIEMFHGQNVSDSGPEFARALNSLYPGRFRIYFTSENVELHRQQLDSMGIEAGLVDTGTYEYAWILAVAGFIFANAGVPVFFSRRPGQVYMQTWHGTPLKTLGKKMRLGLDTLYQAQHGFLQATYLTQPNEFTKNIIMEDYNLERLYTGKVVMAGYPRNSVFLRPEQGAKLRTERGLDGRNVFIYMPTWRGTSWNNKNVTAYAATVREIFAELDSYLTDDDIFYVKFHPILRNAIELAEYDHILPFPQDVEPYAFISCADALVTDYSSIFFDFSLTKKPVILFTYDLDEYLRDRGMYFDIHELPFRLIQTTADLGQCLRDRTYSRDTYEDTDYYKKFFKYDSADIAEKLAALAVEGKEDDLEIIDYSGNSQRPLTLIKPKSFKDLAMLNTIARKADDNTVVWFYTKFFKGRQSELLHDHYGDSFDYVITKNAVPITYEEFDAIRDGTLDEETAGDIWRRDLQRTLPNLNIVSVLSDFGFNEVGYYASPGSAVQGMLTHFVCGGDGILHIGFDCGDLSPDSVVLLNSNYLVLWRRPLVSQERRNRQVELDFGQLVEDLTVYKGESPYIGIVCLDSQGQEQLVMLKSGKEMIEDTPYQDDSGVRYFQGSMLTFMLPADYDKTNLKKLRDSPFEDVNREAKKYSWDRVKKKLLLRPKADWRTDAFLRVNVGAVKSMLGITVSWIVCFGGKIRITAEAPKQKPDRFREARLVYRSHIEDSSVPIQMETTGNDGGTRLILTIDKEMVEGFKPVFWDLEVSVGMGGYDIGSGMSASSRMVRRLLRLLNVQLDIGDGNIIFPYISYKSGNLAFCVRAGTEYDNMRTRIREVTAKVTSKLFRRALNKQNIILVYEKLSATAQDNSYYFFKYCMENLTPAQKKHIFYVMDKSAPDYSKVAMYGRHVVPFMSFRHMLYMLTARLVISTDTKSHLYVWRSKPSFVYDEAKRKNNQIFLQHGVTALKRVDPIFGKKGSSPMKYFVTTSRVEQNIVVRHFGYRRKEAPILGFARWDVLEDKSGDGEKVILLMPTWRSWLEDASDEAFVKSDYYMRYTSLLVSPRLQEMLEKYKARIVLCLHPKFGNHLVTFGDKMGERISLSSAGDMPVNEQIMRCSALITDYSSVCWDTLFLRKPVIFYQFDYDRYMIAHGSYINMRTDLPGYRAEEENELLDHIESCLANNCTLSPEHDEQAAAYFAYRDQNNCRRTYDFIAGLFRPLH